MCGGFSKNQYPLIDFVAVPSLVIIVLGIYVSTREKEKRRGFQDDDGLPSQLVLVLLYFFRLMGIYLLFLYLFSHA